MSTTLRKPSTALQWRPHYSASESAIIDMANSRQIALRERLRNHYWLTECKPISSTSVDLTRRKMMMIDAKDKMTDADVTEVLSAHYGFYATSEGHVIPDIDEARAVAIKSGENHSTNGAKGGYQKAANAAAKVIVTSTRVEALNDPDDDF
jgi:hypothetical protein